MFKKIVAIEPVGLIPSAEKELSKFSEEVIFHRDIPSDDEEIVKRIGNADAVLLSYTSQLNKTVISQCNALRYIGMCNSLYSPESANVDILFAQERNIVVKGIRDYGDEGVVEYVISELVRCLHGFGKDQQGQPRKPWKGRPVEITGLRCGIIGLGKSGSMIADALHFFGAEIHYYSRTRKPHLEKEKGYSYAPLNNLLTQTEAVFCCLNRNTVLLFGEQFEALGNKKIIFNTGLSPAWEKGAFKEWLKSGDNLCFCDSFEALGDKALLSFDGVICKGVSSGRTQQAFDRLSKKVLENIASYFRELARNPN